MRGVYTTVYEFASILGEPGWAYEIRSDGRVVAQGWTRGCKEDAKAEVREAIRVREVRRLELLATVVN